MDDKAIKMFRRFSVGIVINFCARVDINATLNLYMNSVFHDDIVVLKFRILP